MPEASLNLDYQAMLFQYDIGPPGKAAIVQAEAVAEPMQ
jgi:hypothetical protein